jgi:hypothetical protein
VVVIVVGYTHKDEGEYVSPDSMAELSKNFPPRTPEEIPIAQAIMEKMSATNTIDNAMPLAGQRKLLTLHPEDETLIQTVAASNPRTVLV